jgi:predicted membrane protein
MKNIKDIIGFLIFGLLVALALWFGAMLLLFIFITSILLTTFIVLRGYYLRWRYKDSFVKTSKINTQETEATNIIKNTIIDVEYQDISDKK